MSAVRQREALRRADRVAAAAERAVHAWWRELLSILRAGPQLGVTRLHMRTVAHCRRLPGLTRAALRDGLTDLYAWGAASARQGVLETVPRAALRQLAARRQRNVPLREDRTPEPLDALFGFGRFLPDVIPDDLLLRLVLPPPPEAVIRQRVERLVAPFLAAPRPDLVPPERLAGILVQSYSQGKNIQEIAKDLLPHADGVRASARRVARTWGMHVAAESQWEAHEQLGDLVVGYQVHATPGRFSRPWHQDRDGTIYYKRPGPGQKGLGQLPHPPLEAADPAERPPGTPHVAWNCLCRLTPVLASA